MLKLINTLTRKKEKFKPLKKGKILMYHCGATVYWTQHIGNMRASTLCDLIVKTFKYLDFKVKLARNYTDVGHLTGDNEGDPDTGEDRMEKGAKRENLSPQQIADKYIQIYENHIHALNISDADFKPRATQTIPEIIQMVQTLIDKGYAYSTDLAVYFDVSKARDYTRLSGQKLDGQVADAGKGEVVDRQKRNPADFSIWVFKAGTHKNALQTWPSPFSSPLVENGHGFPGWHIECSVMAKKFLGDTIDIHMGGIEHIPIHHPNEIAQSEAANGVKFVNYWLHNEHLMVNNGKMAKSQGTGYSLDEIAEKGFDPLALRYFFLSAHYRSKQNFTWQAMQGAQNGYDNLKKEIEKLKTEKLGNINRKYKDKFIEYISDDFNIPQALALTWDLLKSNLANPDKLATILDFDQVFGLKLDEVKQETIDVPDEVLGLTKQRQQARADRDFVKADVLREKIKEKGFLVEDTEDGFELKKLKQ